MCPRPHQNLAERFDKGINGQGRSRNKHLLSTSCVRTPPPCPVLSSVEGYIMQNPLAPTSVPACECSRGRFCAHQGDQEGLSEAFQGSWNTHLLKPTGLPRALPGRASPGSPFVVCVPQGAGTTVGTHFLCPGPSTSPELVKYLWSDGWKDHQDGRRG